MLASGVGSAKQRAQRGNKQLTQAGAHIDEQLAQMRPRGDKQLAQVGAISDEQLAAISSWRRWARQPHAAHAGRRHRP